MLIYPIISLKWHLVITFGDKIFLKREIQILFDLLKAYDAYTMVHEL